MSTVDYFSEQDLSALVVPSDRYTVITAAASQLLGRGDTLIDSVDITFTVPGRPGYFSTERRLGYIDVVGSGFDLTYEADIVEGLYAL